MAEESHTNNAQVRAHKAKYRKMRAREDAHARETLAKNPPPPVDFRRGERLRVKGRARALDSEQGISTDHTGDTVEVLSTYADQENKRRMVCKTSDGLVRAIPQDSLTRDRPISMLVPRDSSLFASYVSVAMNAQFCGTRCSERRHCVDDHATNGDPEA